ncbi:MAG: hypothetical protein AB7Q27_10745 [Acidimicrobiia bacterium]
MKRLPSVLVILAALAGCRGDDGDATPSTSTTIPSTSMTSSSTTTSTTSPTTSTIAPTTTSTVGTVSSSSAPTTASTSVPTPTGDFRLIIEDLGRRRQSLYAQPDVARIGEVCADDSQCFEQLDVQVGDLATKGWKVVEADPFTVLDARVEKFDGETIDTSLLVTVVAVVERPENGGRIVDAGGAAVANVEAETEVGFNSEGRYILARVGPAEDPWRLASQELIREVPA